MQEHAESTNALTFTDDELAVIQGALLEYDTEDRAIETAYQKVWKYRRDVLGVRVN
jgi:hypothetical protein